MKARPLYFEYFCGVDRRPTHLSLYSKYDKMKPKNIHNGGEFGDQPESFNIYVIEIVI